MGSTPLLQLLVGICAVGGVLGKNKPTCPESNPTRVACSFGPGSLPAGTFDNSTGKCVFGIRTLSTCPEEHDCGMHYDQCRCLTEADARELNQSKKNALLAAGIIALVLLPIVTPLLYKQLIKFRQNYLMRRQNNARQISPHGGAPGVQMQAVQAQISVTVPQGCAGGTVIAVANPYSPGTSFQVQVPLGAVPGTMFAVQAPAPVLVVQPQQQQVGMQQQPGTGAALPVVSRSPCPDGDCRQQCGQKGTDGHCGECCVFHIPVVATAIVGIGGLLGSFATQLTDFVGDCDGRIMGY
jgi:hypothetical protein